MADGVTVEKKSAAPDMAGAMLANFEATVTPLLEQAKAPEPVLIAWGQFLSAIKEWIGG